MEGVRLPGRLADGREGPDASCLAWQPSGSATASPLRPGSSGKIVFQEPPPPQPQPQPTPRSSPRQPAGDFALRFAQALAETPASEGTGERRSLFLRSGDVIPSEITGINEEGVKFRTSMSSSTFVAHDKVKAVELAPETTTVTVKLGKTKRERLLTLPRMQKASPPTHLIRSKNGDYLRGRVVLMDEKRLQVETRLENKDLPARADLADHLAPCRRARPVEEAEADVTGDARAGRPQRRHPRHVLARASRGQYGDGQERDPRRLSRPGRRGGPAPVRRRYRGGGRTAHLWTMEAPECPRADVCLPRRIAADRRAPSRRWSASRPRTSTWTFWMGNGFDLADYKGKVVVLDFWATWCGPCIQSMPMVEKATSEFPEKDVILVAVNLQETPPQIKAMLDRHQFKLSRVSPWTKTEPSPRNTRPTPSLRRSSSAETATSRGCSSASVPTSTTSSATPSRPRSRARSRRSRRSRVNRIAARSTGTAVVLNWISRASLLIYRGPSHAKAPTVLEGSREG